MGLVTAGDGVRLHYEEHGTGPTLIFVHEYAGDAGSWAPQVRVFSAKYRCIAYNARGYPPSDVPASHDQYSQELARDDLRAVVDALAPDRPHLVGLSMGSFAVLHFALADPDRARSLTLAGIGYGAHPSTTEAFRAESRANAAMIREQGMSEFAQTYGHGPARVQFKRKRPRAFRAYTANLVAHSPTGSANTMAGYQGRRPSLYDLTDDIGRIHVPTLIMVGDEDDAAFETSLMLRRVIPNSSLAVFPRSGHVLNAEEPVLFNHLLGSFLKEASRD